MSEWWTYRLSDFLLFSPRTYYRLFELYNTEVWPLHLAALAIGLALAFLSVRRDTWAARAAWGLLAACWLWVGWAFQLQRFASINWAATWFAGAFAAEGLLLMLCVVLPRQRQFGAAGKLRASVGWGLLVFGLAVQPWVGVLLGRPLSQAEVFGLAPDPTVLATLGLLLLQRPANGAGPATGWLAWPIPVVWCLISGTTLWAIHAAEAWVMPLGAALAVLAATWHPATLESGRVQGNTPHTEQP